MVGLVANNQEPVLKIESVELQNEHINEMPDNDDSASKLAIVVYNSPLEVPPLGKRKRKPKESHDDEIAPVITRRKNKPSSSTSKAKQALVVYSGGKSISLSNKQDEPIPLQMKSPTLVRAEQVLYSLGQEYPAFLKVLVRSHVASCFWMGLPNSFCKTYMPKEDVLVTLENENGELFDIKYISDKTGLSAGWRKFATSNKLVEGDILIFQLITPTMFKVFVIRKNDMSEVDGALSLLNLDPPMRKIRIKGPTSSGNKRKKLNADLSISVPLIEQAGNNSEGAISVRFKDIKSFEEFHIVVDGICLDSELPEDVRRKYYLLCCCKNAFLHDKFVPGVNYNLPAGMIYQLVTIVDLIRGCKLTTPRRDFENWDKSLKSFEILGMNVGFIRARLRGLINLAFESEGASDMKRYWEAKTAQACYEEEIECIKEKLHGLKQAFHNINVDVENLRTKAERYEIKFQQEVNAPW